MSEIEVSFCATNLDTASTLSACLASIEALGTTLDRPFEIVVADGPSPPAVRASLAEWAAAGPRRHLVLHPERNRGYGRRRAFEASSGTYIIPFDTSIVYPSTYGELVRRYLDLRSERMLFSEICALSRSSIVAVGGWRDLIGAEDLDLYAPVAAKFGLIAYPTGERSSQSKVMGQYARQMRYTQGGQVRRLYRMFVIQRDQVIGANYRVPDLMAFNTAKPLGARFAIRGWFAAAIAAAAFSPIRRRSVGEENNYLFLRNRILDSLIRGDYRELGWVEGPEPRLPLTPDEMRYLEQKSESWPIAKARIPEYLVVKGASPSETAPRSLRAS